MFDLDGHVVCHGRKFTVKRSDELQSVTNTIKEIWIAEGNVLRANSNLPANIFKNHVLADDSKDSLVDWHDRAMPAKMFATAARFRRTDNSVAFAGNNEMRVFLDRRHS